MNRSIVFVMLFCVCILHTARAEEGVEQQFEKAGIDEENQLTVDEIIDEESYEDISVEAEAEEEGVEQQFETAGIDEENQLTVDEIIDEESFEDRSVEAEAEEIELETRHKGCPDHWLSFKRKCYKAFGSKMSWSDASKYCEDRDAHLVVIKDSSENGFVHSHKKNQKMWIGLKRSGVRFAWVRNEGSNYSRWLFGQPNNLGSNEDCVSMTNWGKWLDLRCSKRQSFMCEKP